MRITQRYLKESLQKEFDRLKVEWEAVAIYKTRCTQNQYECGASHYNIKIVNKNNSENFTYVFVFYPLRYLQKELNNGYELYWAPKDGEYLRDSELNIRRKIKQ